MTHPVVIAGVALSFALAGIPPDEDSARAVMARTASVYADMRHSFLMRVHLSREQTWGEGQSHKIEREYRLIQVGDRIRADVLETRGPIIMMKSGSKMLLYISLFNEYMEVAENAADAEPIHTALLRLHGTLYKRLADLAQTKYVVTSFGDSEIKAQGQRRKCYHIKFKQPPGEAQPWSGELWIDRNSSLVWRARLFKRSAPGQFLNEEITWEEIASGPDVPAAELDWRPPADSGILRRPRIPAILP
jgi:hypothetical protein